MPSLRHVRRVAELGSLGRCTRMITFKTLCLCGGLLLVCSGCSSVASRLTYAYGKARPFEGVRCDANLIAHPPDPYGTPPCPPIIVVPYAIVDIAPSAAIDLLFLPFDLARDGEKDSPQ